MELDPRTWTGWQAGLLLGGLLLLSLELALALLRRLARRPTTGILRHLWAVSVGAFAFVVNAPPQRALIARLVIAAAILLTAHVAYSLLNELLLQRPWDRERGAVAPKLVIDVVRTGVLVTVALVVANRVFGAHLSTILVSSTVLSAVVGFALQDVLRNLFAGMALQVERPFENGHWLSLDGTPAQVVDMTWRSTRLRTNEGVFLVEPNADLAARRLVAYGGGEPPVAFGFRVGLGYDAPPDRVKAALLEAAAEAPGALSHPAPQAFVDEFSDSAITYHLRVWTRQVRSIVVFRDAVQTRMWHALQRHGLVVPFPIRTLHFHDMEKVERARRDEDLRRVGTLLAGLDLFRECEPATLESLAAAASRRRYDAGERLVEEGQAGDSLFVVEAGRVEVRKGDPQAETSVTVATLGPASFFGEMSLLTGEPRAASVTALEPCSVLVLDRASVKPVMSGDPNLAWVLSRALASRAAELAEKVEDRRRARGAEVGEITEANLLKKIRSFFRLS